jgi:serine phosphatase RsbU (regulator of sigma subunit)
MQLESPEPYVRDLIERVIKPDQEACDDLARVIDTFFLPRWQFPLEPSFDAAASHVQTAVVLDATRLEVCPPSPLEWIHSRTLHHLTAWVAQNRPDSANLRNRMLPANSFEIRGLQIAFQMRPFDVFSGDFCDCYRGDDDVLFTLGDVRGKATPAAIVAALILGKLRLSTKQSREPEEILTQLNRLLLRWPPGDVITTVVLARWRPASSELVIVNAGHVPPRFARDGIVEELAPSCIPLGSQAEAACQAERRSAMPGDLIVLATDGVAEPMEDEGPDFPLTAAAARLSIPADASAASTLAALWRELDSMVTGPQRDDQSLMVLRFVD